VNADGVKGSAAKLPSRWRELTREPIVRVCLATANSYVSVVPDSTVLEMIVVLDTKVAEQLLAQIIELNRGSGRR
jgi:hypothetical protein